MELLYTVFESFGQNQIVNYAPVIHSVFKSDTVLCICYTHCFISNLMDCSMYLSCMLCVIDDYVHCLECQLLQIVLMTIWIHSVIFIKIIFTLYCILTILYCIEGVT